MSRVVYSTANPHAWAQQLKSSERELDGSFTEDAGHGTEA